MGDTTSDIGTIYRQELQRRGVPLTPANLQSLVMATRRGEVQLPDLTVQGVDPAQPATSQARRQQSTMPTPPRPPSTGGTSTSNVENVGDSGDRAPPSGGVSPPIAAPSGKETPTPRTTDRPSPDAVTPGDPEGSATDFHGRTVGSYGPPDIMGGIVQSILGLVPSIPGPARAAPGLTLAPPRSAAPTPPVGSPGAMPAQVEPSADPASTAPAAQPSNMVGNTGLTSGQVAGGTAGAAGAAGLAALVQSILRRRSGVQPPVPVDFPPPAAAPTMPPRPVPTGGPSQQDTVLQAVPQKVTPVPVQGGPPPATDTQSGNRSYDADHAAVMDEIKKSDEPKVSPDVRAATRRANRVRLPR